MDIDLNGSAQYASGEDTARLQAAIDRCAESGGGRVTVPGGRTYVIDGIILRSNVELHLEKNARLLGSGREEKYIKRPGPFERLRNDTPICGLVFASGAENISITGEGTLDGNYREFIPAGQEGVKHLRFYKYPRPMTVYFEDCRNVNLKDITIKDAPFWTVHLVGCVGSNITGVKIFNDRCMPNTDGFDIDRCKNTYLSGCVVVTGDDAVCPKCTEETARYGDCENIYVENCRLTSASSAVKFGSSSFGNFRNCVFENLEISESNRGLAFQLRDTGDAENIVFRNISVGTERYSEDWWGCGEPIYVTCCPREDGLTGGNIRNIVFDNIKCACENGIFICGGAPGAVDGVRFSDVSLDFRRVTQYPLSRYDLRPWKGEPLVFEELSPVFAVNARNVEFDDFKVIDPDGILVKRENTLRNCENITEI